jgi:hypothetical protein
VHRLIHFLSKMKKQEERPEKQKLPRAAVLRENAGKALEHITREKNKASKWPGSLVTKESKARHKEVETRGHDRTTA